MTIRPALRLALSAILGTATLAAAETTYLPGAAEVTGLAGARFSSTLEVSNPGATGTTATIGLVPMAGKAAPSPVTRTLAAGESLRISEALKTLFGLTDGAAGTLVVTSDVPLLANLSTRNVAAPEGAYGLGLLPVPSADLLGAGETGHSIWVSQSADPSTGYRTNLSVTLADPGTVVEVRVFDAEGRVVGTATVTAATPEVWQQPATALIGAATDLPVGRAEFEVKAGRATAYAVVNDNVTSDAIALQTERVVPGPTDRLISGAALSPGHLGSFWSTDLRLFNPGSTAVDATIQSVGASREASAVVPVPAKGVVEVSRVLALLGFPEGTACALRVRGGSSLLVAARTNNVDPAGVRKGTFSAQQFVTSWPAGLLGAGAVGFFNGIDQTLNVPGARTNLTVVGGPEGAAGELVLRDAAGLERGRTSFTRGPGAWGQLGVADWFAPATVPENARIDVSVATGALDAFVSRIDNGSGDAVTRPVTLPGGGDCSKIAVTSFVAAPLPIAPGVEETFSWSVAIDPPTAELTSQAISFDGEPEVELGKEVRSYKRTFATAGARSVTLTVRKGSCVKTRSLSFFVCGPLSLEPTTLPDGTAFAAYPIRTLTVPGATAPTTFTVDAGALPDGLTLSLAGELSGKAKEVGFFSFTAKAVDANGCVGTRAYSIRIFCPTLRIAPSSLPAGTVATPYTSTRLTVTGGSGTGTWSATGLPPGLTLSASGQLSGTPTAAGSYAASIRFRDSSGCDETVAYTILVCNTLTVAPSAVPAGTAGTPYGPVGFAAAGSTGAATWAVTAGSLPAGVTLSAAGLLSGTPTVVGTFPVTITATDTLGCTGSAAVSLVVSCPAITVNPATLVAAFEDAPYTATLTQTGASAGATFTVVAGALPSGLTLAAATGVLSGTVAVPGNTNFTVRATDPVNGCFGDRAYTFTVTPVNDAPSFVKGPDVSILEDSGAYSAGWATTISAGPVDEAAQVLTFNVTGNTNPALFSVAPSVSAAGVIGFTPALNASGTATITLTLSDDGGTANGGADTSAAQTFVVTVTDVNDAPSFTKGPDVTVLEDAAAYSAPWATALSTGPAAEAGQTLSFSVTGNTNAALFSVAPAVSAAGVLSFTPAANANGTATVTLTLSDNGGVANGGVDTSAAQSFVVNVTAVNDAPSFTKGPDVTVLEDSGAHTAATWATAIVTGPADESAQTVSFAVTGNTNAALFSVAPAVSPTGALTFTPAANVSGSATITLTLSDSGGTANSGADTSAAQTFVVNVTDVNDAPSFAKGPDVTVLEDATAYSAAWATALSAGPASESGQTLTFIVTGNTNAALFSAAPAVSAAGVLSFTPAANANGTATITLTISDNGGTANGGVATSAAQTFVVNVTAVNDAPSFTKGADVTVLEESGAQTVNPWATALSRGPADEAGQTLTFNVTGNTNAALFSVAPAVSATGVLTFTPAANASGTATITLTLSDDGGTANGGVDTSVAQTFVVNVTDVNDAPSFTKGADQTVLEDAGAQTVNPWATALSAGPASEAGQTLSFSITGNSNPALFSVAPAVSPTGVLTYTPAANANGTATITLTISDNGGTANGGVNVSAPQSFVINVTAVNDAPSFTKGADQTVFDNAGAQTVNPWATAISKGPADEASQTVTFNVTVNTNPAFFSVAPSIDASGVLTYTPTPSSGGTATITITLSDNGGVANGGVNTSAAQTFTITFNHVNVAPSFTKGADQTVNEDAVAQTVNPWASAISPGPPVEVGQTLTFNVTNNTNPGLFAAGPAISPAGVLTYTPAANAFGTATITVTLSDNGGTANAGADTSAPQTFVITVNAVNDVPSFTKGADQTVNEDAGAQTANPWATALSAGPASEAGQTLTFNVTGNTNPALFSAGPAISSTGVLTYTPAPNASGTATITITLQDNGGTANGGVDISASQAFVITVNNVNDAPSFTKGGDQTVLEDAGAQTVSPWATAFSAGPASEAGQTLTFNVTANTNTALFSAGPAVSSTGVLTYTPAANAFGTATITITLQDNGGTANGGVDTSAPQSFVITVTPVNDPPAAGSDAWDTIGNTELRVDLGAAATPHVLETTGTLNGVVGNDADTVEGDPFTVTSVVDCPALPSPLACTLPSGAAISMNANGTFSFTPPTTLATGAPTTTTFQYVITDSPAVGTAASATGTVTISVYDKVWYVRQGATGGNGTSALPLGDFTTLNGVGGAGDVDAASDVVFVHNSGSLSGSIELEASQSLLGEGVGLSINRNLNANGAPTNLVAAGTQPPVTSAVDTVRVTAAWPAAIRGLALSSSGGNAIDVTTAAALSGAASLTIDANSFNGTLLEGIDVNFNAGTSGTRALAISGNTFPVASTGNALDARTLAGNLELSVSGPWYSNANGILIDGSGGGSITVTGFANNTVDGNTGAIGIWVNTAKFDQTPGGSFDTVSGGATAVGASGNGVGASGVVLTSVSGDLSFTDLDVYADGGAGLRASGTTTYTGSAGFRVSVGAGVSVIAATGGPAVDLSTVTATLPFQRVTSTNSATTGVALNSLLGSFSAGSSSSISNITSAAGTAFLVGSSNATISYAGTINTTTGKGIDLTSNTGSTIGFTGTLTLSTAANPAFNATGGGTVTATDTASTLTTTTGTALNVASTTIGAGGLVFRSITANGGANGIVLNTTGSTGGLTVSGTGSAGSGGTIRNMVGADGGVAGNGVYLSSTNNVSLSWMQLNDFQNFAIRGVGVTGFTLANSVINGTNGNSAAADEGSISFSGLTGSASVTSTNISGGLEDNFRLVNTSGTLNRITFSSVTIGLNSTTDGNDGILLEAQTGATVNVTVQNSTFTSARGDLFQLNHIGTAPCDLVFTGNTLTNNHPAIATGGGGVTIGGSGTGNLTYVISGNSFRDSDGHAVLLVKSTSAASYTGSFSSNSIGVAGVADSGSKAGSGLRVQNAGGGEMRISATNNQIRQYNNFGIELLTGGSASPQGGQLNATVTGNTISNPGTGGLPMNGIHLNGGTVVGDTYTICASIGGVGGLANAVTGSGANGGTDIRLRQRQATTVRLPGYGGANNDNTAVQGYVATNNGLPVANVLAANTVPTGGGYVGGAPCP